MKALQYGSVAVFVPNDSEKPMEIEAESSANDICAVWKRDIVEFRLPKVESAAPQGTAFDAMMSARQPAASAHVQPQQVNGQVELYLPPRKDARETQDRVICREILDLLRRMGLGWANNWCCGPVGRAPARGAAAPRCPRAALAPWAPVAGAYAPVVHARQQPHTYTRRAAPRRGRRRCRKATAAHGRKSAACPSVRSALAHHSVDRGGRMQFVLGPLGTTETSYSPF